MNRYTHTNFFWLMAALSGILVLTACRGQKSTSPPFHLVLNMDNQEKFRAFGENTFFADGRSMRPFIPGTVPRGLLNADEAYHTGKTNTKYVANPNKLTPAFLERGMERFTIYCAVCHGEGGDGNSIMKLKGFTPAPSYHEQRLLDMPDGQLFEVISNGIRTMPAMKMQVPVADRWAIVYYIRALQKSRNATLQDVPPDQRSQLK